MKKFILVISFLFLLLGLNTDLFADVKVKQRVTIGGQSIEQTRMIKDARERSESKINLPAGETGGFVMPQIAQITQCDLKRTLNVNDSAKTYVASSFPEEDSSASRLPPKSSSGPKRGGTVVITYSITDTGERKNIFGLQARHLKVLQMMESSADSCSGATKTKSEIDGWYADFSADYNCPFSPPELKPEKSNCRDRVIIRQSGGTRLGFLLEGTTTLTDGTGKTQNVSKLETLEISRTPLNASLFDIGRDYTEVASVEELYAPSMAAMMKMASSEGEVGENPSTPTNDKKNLGLDFFSGNSSGINQDSIRQTMMENLNSNGFATSLITSPNEIASGRYDYVIGVEIKQAKQSKAGKIGGLFGKVTGNSDAAKLGDSEADVVVTLYQKDGKTVVTKQTAKQKIAGTLDDAVKQSILGVLGSLTENIK